MTNKNIPLARRIYRIVLSVSIIIAGILLILGCINIFWNGNGYSRNIVANVFSMIDIPIYWCLSLIIGDVIWEFISPITKETKNINKKINAPKKEVTKSNKLAIKITIISIAVTALIIGLIFGGYADVLTKAINICTECIGLG